jgi:glycosyltransferase involved in cell wall biosynthesis
MAAAPQAMLQGITGGLMDSEVSISVVIPARNAEKTLARALDSVLVQRRAPCETIIVDDASSDTTAAIAARFADRGVRIVALDRQRGAAGARNVGIEAARGVWIAFLDADDEWLPYKLEKQVAAIRARPDVSFVFCASHEFASSGRFLGDTYQGRPVRDDENAWKALLACNFVATPTVVARRELLLRLGGFNEALKVAEDQDMWIRLALEVAPAYVPESLVRVHVRHESLSAWRLGDQYTYTLPMVERHLERLRPRLAATEIKAIRGERLHRVGSVAMAQGDFLHGMSLILRSALLGYRPQHNMMLLARLPVAKLANRLARGFRARKFGKARACAR